MGFVEVGLCFWVGLILRYLGLGCCDVYFGEM